MGKKQLKLTLRNGHWSKRVKGRTHYFGSDYEAAVVEWEKQEPFLKSGIEFPEVDDGAKLADLLDEFLSDRLQKVELGLMGQETYDGYVYVCDKIASAIPVDIHLNLLKPTHFATLRECLSKGKRKTLCLKSHDRWLGYARAVFRFASIDGFLVDRPLPYTRALACVPKREMRRYRSGRPSRLLDADDIKYVLDNAQKKLRCMVLLAINGGFNNRDLAMLEVAKVSPVPSVLDYPRRKTYFPRMTPLWPETQEAIERVLESRQTNSKSPNLFVTKYGNNYFEKKLSIISDLFRDQLRNGDRYKEGKNFGALRTTFAEVGREVGDDLALKALMGHSDGSMLYEQYVSGVYVPRLEKITSHVHHWLFG